MTGNIRATFIWILVFAFAIICGDGSFAQTGNYTRALQALEYRISRLEKGLKEVSDLSMKGVENTRGFYQEAGTILKGTKSRIDSLERRTTEAERKQAVVEDLKSRVETLEEERLKIERKQVVAKERGVDTGLLARKGLKGWRGEQMTRNKQVSGANYDDSSRERTQTPLIRRLLRQGETVRIFTFEAYTSRGVKTEIRYYTVRHISPEEIEWPDYCVGDLKHLKLVDSKVLLPFTEIE